MKSKPIKAVALIILAMIFSCDEPETVITNTVHSDGSVTRKIEMRNVVNKFTISGSQVPFDSTWIVKDSLEIDEDGDTIWVKLAEKRFKNSDEINKAYRTDSGCNKEISRRTEFSKKFKWFKTEYRFAEIIDKTMSAGYPISEFLNNEELQWFYSPEKLTGEKEHGPDSLKFRALNDTVKKKVEKWSIKCFASEWIHEFVRLTEGKAGNDLSSEALKIREREFERLIEANMEKFDSLWSAGMLFNGIIGEANALEYKAEADSAVNLAIEKVFISFSDYTVRIAMPGKVIGTNGFMDSARISQWPVKSEFFLSQPYEMWAESKVANKWAWIISGLILLFAMTAILIKARKKG